MTYPTLIGPSYGLAGKPLQKVLFCFLVRFVFCVHLFISFSFLLYYVWQQRRSFFLLCSLALSFAQNLSFLIRSRSFFRLSFPLFFLSFFSFFSSPFPLSFSLFHLFFQDMGGDNNDDNNTKRSSTVVMGINAALATFSSATKAGRPPQGSYS